MPYTIVQVGATVVRLDTNGAATTLTLPSGVTIDATQRMRFAILGHNIVGVNSPTTNLWFPNLAADTQIKPMALVPPSSAPTAAAGSGTGLTGIYLAKYSFLIKDTYNRVVSESQLSPPSTATSSLSNKSLQVTNIGVSAETGVNARRIYRTASGGATYFHWGDLDDNTSTTFENGWSDSSLSLVAASTTLGLAPRFRLITSWRDSLWGNSVSAIDTVQYSDPQTTTAWPAANSLNVPPLGRDGYGVTAFIPRRDELGIGRRDFLWKVTGSSSSDFALTKVAEGIGIIAPDSVVVIRDVGYFLALDGVYAFGPGGVAKVSTRADVEKWFTTDTYFNRARFPFATALYNQKYDTYDLHLAATGSSVEDRWVSLDVGRTEREGRGVWLGPHKTDLSGSTTCTAVLLDANSLAVPSVGRTDGILYNLNRIAFVDGSATAIDFDVTTKFHSMSLPDRQKFFGELGVISKVQASGTCTITPTVGGLDASAGTTISHDLTTGRQRLRRLGAGRFAQLRFQQAANAVGCELYGYELPWFEYGRR